MDTTTTNGAGNVPAKIETVEGVLSSIQTRLSARKTERNNFGGYNYRSAENILEALKPLLREHGASVVLSDELTALGERVYIRATATLRACGHSLSATGFAREPLSRKGMDEAQVTGSSVSYARKYALCGLFAIDDSRDDPDRVNTHGKDAPSLTASQREVFAHARNTRELETTAKMFLSKGFSRASVVEAWNANRARCLKADQEQAKKDADNPPSLADDAKPLDPKDF